MTDSEQLQAVAAERARITGIQAIGKPGQDHLIAECVNDPGCSVADAALRIIRAEKQTNVAYLAALEADCGRVQIGPVNPGALDAGSASLEAQRIVALHNQVNGRKTA